MNWVGRGFGIAEGVAESEGGDQFKAGKWDVVAFEARANVGGVWYVALNALSSPAECL